MNITNYENYGMVIYHTFKLGDVVINNENEIGVVIQIHDQFEFRTDMFGNTSNDEVRMATDKEIKKYRPNILNEGSFKHNKNLHHANN